MTPRTRPRLRHRLLGAVVVVVLAAWAGAMAPAQAAPTQAADPAEPILAIVSPLAAPACAAAGVATFLVPILGGLVGDNLGISGQVNVADLVLDSIGPLYIVCGSLPESPGTRCSLDASIAGVWPAELVTFGLSAPVILGNVVDAISAVLGLVGVPPVAQIAQAFECVVPGAASATDAPGAAAPAPGVVALPPTSGGGVVPPPSSAGFPSAAPAAPALPAARPPADGPVLGRLASTLDDEVPGGLLALQLVVAGLLLGALARGWYSSWRLVRHDR